MTGKYAVHIGMHHNVIETQSPWGLLLSEKLMPEHLQSLGYRSYMVCGVCVYERVSKTGTRTWTGAETSDRPRANNINTVLSFKFLPYQLSMVG